MTKEKREKIEPIISWIIAMIMCPLGVCLSVKSAFGVSMIEAPVFVLHLKISEYFSWYTFGMSEYVLQATLILIMCIIIRKFHWKYLLSFVTAFIFGWILDGWNLIFKNFAPTGIPARIIIAIVGCVITSISVSMFFRTWLPLEVWELFVKEVAEKFHAKITLVKYIYDYSSLALGIILMLVFFGKFRLDVIGIGTIVTTIVNSPLIALFTKLQDKAWNKITK